MHRGERPGWRVKLCRRIAAKAEEVADLFDQNAGEPLVTVLVRCPWLEDGDVLVTCDADLGAVLRAIETLSGREVVWGMPVMPDVVEGVSTAGRGLPQRCRKCGCDDLHACRTPDGPCRWIEPGLCSACHRSA